MKYRIIKLSGYEKYRVQTLRSVSVGFFKITEKWVLYEEGNFCIEYDSIEAAQSEIDEREERNAIETGDWEPISEK